MKKIILLYLGTLCSMHVFSQAAYLADPENFDPESEIKIMIDTKLLDASLEHVQGLNEAISNGEDMFIWTWKPNEHGEGHPLVNGIGAQAWKNSNDALKMTNEGDGIFSFSMVPTEFYEVDAQTVYDEDFSLLIKPKDGGGYGDPDIKSEDLKIVVNPPAGPIVKIKSFPSAIGSGLEGDTLGTDQLDVFSLIYDNAGETKESLKGVDDLYIYPEVVLKGGEILKIAGNAKKVADFPELQMKSDGDGVFIISFIPQYFFKLSENQSIESMQFTITRPNLVNSDDVVDEVSIFFINANVCR